MRRAANLGDLIFYGVDNMESPILDSGSRMLLLKTEEVDTLYALIKARHENTPEYDNNLDWIESPAVDCLSIFAQHHEDAPQVKGRIFVPKDTFKDLFVLVSKEFAEAILVHAQQTDESIRMKSSLTYDLTRHDILSRVYAVLVHAIKRDLTIVLQSTPNRKPKSNKEKT